jgi:hypothetical protein
MKIILFLVVILYSPIFCQGSYEFSELRGKEDDSGNTQLYYRLYAFNPAVSSWWGPEENNSVYRYDTYKDSQYVLLYDAGWRYVRYDEINDFSFSGSNIYYLYTLYVETEPEGIILRNGESLASHDNLPDLFWQKGERIFVSNQDTNIIYTAFSTGDYISKDYGKTWNRFSDTYRLLSVSPYNDKFIFAYNSQGLYKSTDMGVTFTLSDTGNYYRTKLFYASDSVHIYRLNGKQNILSLSEDKGETWQEIYTDKTNDIIIYPDALESGSLYLAAGGKIYYSKDFGKTFRLDNTLEGNITGIYKKPGSDVLYFTTQYNLYKAENGNKEIIKHLDIIPEVMEWYPLAKGNKWFYNYELTVGIQTEKGKIISEVTDIIQEGNQKYYELTERTKTDGKEGISYGKKYLWIDSLNGRIYSVNKTADTFYIENLIGDFITQKDTIYADSGYYLFCNYNNKRVFDCDQKIREFYNPVMVYTYVFADGAGIIEESGYELLSYRKYLKGAVIGKNVYGDTTLTSVKDEPISEMQYDLLQNYPNPFNPETNIKYTVKSRGYVTLKVYDILGNEIITLVNEEKPAGNYEVKFNGSGLASGIYIYKLTSGNFIKARKLLLLK